MISMMILCVIALSFNFFAYALEPLIDAYKEKRMERRKEWERSIEKRIKEIEKKLEK
jgi:hypothetical protein